MSKSIDFDMQNIVASLLVILLIRVRNSLLFRGQRKTSHINGLLSLINLLIFKDFKYIHVPKCSIHQTVKHSNILSVLWGFHYLDYFCSLGFGRESRGNTPLIGTMQSLLNTRYENLLWIYLKKTWIRFSL